MNARVKRKPDCEWWVEVLTDGGAWEFDAICPTKLRAFEHAEFKAKRFQVRARVIEIARYPLQEFHP